MTAQLEVEARDTAGKRRQVRLRAVPIGTVHTVNKADQVVGDAANQNIDVATSREEEDQAFSSVSGRHSILSPPYNLQALIQLCDKSTELRQNIDALVTNVVGFGWGLRERAMPEALRKQLKAEIEAEKFMLQAKLETVHPVLSLTNIRKKVQHDKHLVGNGYLELIEDKTSNLVSLSHIPGHSIRLTIRDQKPTLIEVPRIRPDLGFKIEFVPMWYKFRRYVQRLQGGKVIWFKEAGDPRHLDKDTGDFVADLPFAQRATSLIHDRLYHPGTPYGVPLFIGNTLSILGSRASDEINYNTLNSNAIPSAMVIVEGGVLTEGSIARIQEWTEEQIKKSSNYSKFLLLEAEASEDGSLNPGNFRIRVEPMKRLQQNDELFQLYDSNNRDKIRQAFRLPPIFVGRSDDYTRATADTSRDIADEQIFDPERQDVDHLLNRFVLSKWGARFHVFKSRTPNVTDDIELIRLMAIGEKSGAITPRRADRIIRDVFGDDIGPMPQGLDLDKPFMLSFAEAQSGKSSAPGMSTGKTSDPTGLVSSLVSLREKIEKALVADVEEPFYIEEGLIHEDSDSES